MTIIERELVVQDDGQLVLDHLPCRKGDHVTARLVIAGASPPQSREAALAEFIALARKSKFRSAAPYPTRDELHDRP